MPQPRRTWWRWLVVGCVLLVVGLAGVITWGMIASQQVPEFYVQAAEIPVAKATEDSERLERAVIQLQNEVRTDDRFYLSFTAEEVNGWLATDLVEKFPKLLPAGIKEPRVALQPNTILIGFRAEQGVKTVVTLAFEPLLVADSNLLAVRVRQVKAGAISIPLGPMLQEIAERAEKARIPLRWEHNGGVPTAMIPLQFLSEAFPDRHIVVETLTIETDKLTLAGRMVKHEKPAAPN